MSSAASSSTSETKKPVLKLHETTLSENAAQEDDSQYWCVFGGKEFSSGSVRSVFKGVFCGKGERDGQTCLVKIFKKGIAKEVDDVIPDLAASMKTAELAEIFNEAMEDADCVQNYRPIQVEMPLICKVLKPVSQGDLARPKIFKALKILLQAKGPLDLLAKFQKSSKKSLDLKPEYVSLEKFFPGEYEKFNSNWGYENPASSIMPTFCHWTFEYTERELMTCDLQGVKLEDKYLITDPAIHTIEGKKYGITDLGLDGMIKVMQTHKCNFICKKLGLKNQFANGRLPATFKSSSSTTYSFEVDKLPKELIKKYKAALEIIEE